MGRTPKPSGYWKELENMRSELEKLWEERPDLEGKLPSYHWMQKNGYSYLITPIATHHGGVKKLREQLGQETETELGRKYNQYIDLGQVQTSLEELWDQFPEIRGTLPSHDWMRAHGCSDLGNAIVRNHNGFIETRKKLGITQTQKANRYRKGELSDPERLAEAIKEMHEAYPETSGTIPAVTWMQKNGYGAIVTAIRKRPGGLRAMRESLGQEEMRREDGSLKDFNYVKNELEKIIERTTELDGTCPTFTWLQKNGHGSLAGAIHTYHGGISRFQDIFGGTNDRRINGYWEEWENFERELNEAIERNDGKFPSLGVLKDMDLSSLANAFNNFGGVYEVKKKMGYRQETKPLHYWKKWENIVTNLAEAISIIGHFPTQKELRENGYSKLVSGLVHHGGINGVREKYYAENDIELERDQTKFRSLLEQYAEGGDPNE